MSSLRAAAQEARSDPTASCRTVTVRETVAKHRLPQAGLTRLGEAPFSDERWVVLLERPFERRHNSRFVRIRLQQAPRRWLWCVRRQWIPRYLCAPAAPNCKRDDGAALPRNGTLPHNSVIAHNFHSYSYRSDGLVAAAANACGPLSESGESRQAWRDRSVGRSIGMASRTCAVRAVRRQQCSALFDRQFVGTDRRSGVCAAASRRSMGPLQAADYSRTYGLHR